MEPEGFSNISDLFIGCGVKEKEESWDDIYPSVGK